MQFLDHFPFVCLDFILMELYLTDVSDLVDCLFVPVGKVKHIISCIPASADIMGHHLCIEGKRVKYPVSLRKGNSARVFYCESKFANLS